MAKGVPWSFRHSRRLRRPPAKELRHTTLVAASDRDDRATIAAIAILAFAFADIGHEVIGHGVGFLLAGGKAAVLTSTRLIETQRLGDRGSDIFDLGGPLGNLLFGAAPWIAQRWLRGPAPRFRLLLWLAMAFSLFWAFGYLIFCGVFSRGDWLALIRGLPYQWAWRILFVVIGLVLYRAAVRLAASELRWIVRLADRDAPARVRRLVLISYIAGGTIACAGAAFDPRGAVEMLNSGALSSFGAAAGLLLIPSLVSTFQPQLGTGHGGASGHLIHRSAAWIVFAAVMSILYIGVLGPGLIRLGTVAAAQNRTL